MAFLLMLLPILCVWLEIMHILNNKSGIDLGATPNVSDGDVFHFVVPIFLFFMFFSIVLFLKRKKKRYLISFIINFIALSIFIFINVFNVDIDYDVWLRRGMPGPFEFSLGKG